MHTKLPTRSSALRPVASWACAAALTLGALFGASSTFAAAPPANTLIGNQATAAYTDAAGSSQTATSNLVQTSIQQVGAFTLTADTTKSAAGGNIVYAPHTLTNTGNGTDSFTLKITDDTTSAYNFSKIEVYADANGDGVPDSTTALCSAVPTATCDVPAQTVAGNGGEFKFVVAYTVPVGAATSASNTATVVAAPVSTSPVLASYSPGSVTNTDTVNVTNVAAFSATKSISVPAVSPPSGSWPVAATSGPVSAASCSTAWPVTTSATCDYTVFTINYKNTGGAAGAFYVQDTLPAGFTYVTGSAVWSSAGGQALTEAAGSETVAGIDFAQSGQQLAARIASVGPNVSGTISFAVRVNSTATVGTGATTNTATYDPLSTTNTAAAPATVGSSNTNPAAFTVTATVSVVVGGSSGTTTGSLDTTAGTPNGSAADSNTASSIVAGGTVSFTQTVFNTGNAADTVNLSTSSSTFPSGSTYTFYAADGVTPLLDTNGDGTVDTGSIAAGASTTIVVKVKIPASTAAGTGPYSVTVLGTSVADSTKKDAALDTVTIVVGSLVDLTNTSGGTGVGTVGNGDLGAGPSPSPTTINTTPAGTGTIFKLFVKNNDTASQTYDLAASQTASFPGSLPSGWTVKFVAAGGTCTGAAITTVTVGNGTQTQVDACVTPPVSQAAGTTNVYFKVTSTGNSPTTGVVVSDTKLDAVTVTTANTFGATLTPDNNGQVSPGGTVVYPHTLNTTGAQACGTYTLNATQSNASSGWTYALFLDVNGDGQIDSGDTSVAPGTTVNPALAAGGSQKILVRVFAPGGAVAGIQDTVVVTATFAAANGGTCGPVSATDISTVVTGQIRVVKTQALDATCDGNADTAFSATLISNAKPGACVIYKIVATNEGTAPITNLTLNDAVPNFTSLTGATQPSSPCVKSTSVTGTVAFASTTTTVSCGTATSVPPSGTLELDFAVKINQ